MDYDNAWLQSIFDARMPEAGYAVREEQLAMANFVQTALVKNRHLLAEAGVGTGKTFAYLLPALGHLSRTGRPVIIATHTIALQEQLVERDIPAIRHLLKEPVQALLAKGKEHYLCPMREMRLREERPEPTEAEARVFAWARKTRTGDRSELEGVPEALWQRINLDERHRCAGCRYEFTCPTANTRRKWQGAYGFIVTNHHQFFADMALRASGGHIFALPGAIVLDEAHAVADTAREILGHRVALPALSGLVKQSRFALHREDRSWEGVLTRAEAFQETLLGHVRWNAGEEATRFEIRRDAELTARTTGFYDGLQNLIERIGGLKDTPERLEMVARLQGAQAALRGLLNAEAHIAWVEGTKGKRHAPTELVNAPRHLAGILQTRLFGRGVPVVMTSATLSVNEDFTYLKEELGVEKPLACSVGSPFDFERQARLYIAEDLPDPSEHMDAYYAAALERLKELLVATRGRALVLFTAKSRMETAYQALKTWGRYPIYRQDRSQPDLLARFQRETEAVLLGTAYWEGIDMPGETLSCVVVMKLPFPPEDPLLAAKQEAARERGEDPFEAVLLPEMVLKLKQGVGRLIRRTTDRGVIAILDPRTVTRERYAETVLESLPQAPRVSTLEDVQAFLDTSQNRVPPHGGTSPAKG